MQAGSAFRRIHHFRTVDGTDVPSRCMAHFFFFSSADGIHSGRVKEGAADAHVTAGEEGVDDARQRDGTAQAARAWVQGLRSSVPSRAALAVGLDRGRVPLILSPCRFLPWRGGGVVRHVYYM